MSTIAGRVETKGDVSRVVVAADSRGTMESDIWPGVDQKIWSARGNGWSVGVGMAGSSDLTEICRFAAPAVLEEKRSKRFWNSSREAAYEACLAMKSVFGTFGAETMTNDGSLPSYDTNGLIAVDVDGYVSLWMFWSSLVPDRVDDFFAVGSGSSYAMGAMASGASPVDAIRVSERFDTSTHSPVATFEVDGKPAPRD